MFQQSLVVLLTVIFCAICDEKAIQENVKIGSPERTSRQMDYYNRNPTGMNLFNKQYDNRYNLHQINKNTYGQLTDLRRQAFFPLKNNYKYGNSPIRDNRNPIRTYQNPTFNRQNSVQLNRRPVTRRPSISTSKKPVTKKKFKPSFIMI